MNSVAEYLDLPTIQVYEVATFYSMFQTREVGRNEVAICTNVACMKPETSALLDALKERFGLTPGSTTSDNRYTLIEAECIGECEKSPAMLVDHDVYTRLTLESLLEILESYE